MYSKPDVTFPTEFGGISLKNPWCVVGPAHEPSMHLDEQGGQAALTLGHKKSVRELTQTGQLSP
jgi:hypothetical protein